MQAKLISRSSEHDFAYSGMLIGREVGAPLVAG
jgi:hypothetical protein